ncbi:MAG: hypothetical protein AB9834_02005 [Lentimicrobium sp.]
MNNRVNLHSDGICIYMDSYVGAALTGKIILIVMNLLGWSLFLYAAISIPGEEMGSFIIPLVIFVLVLVFGLGRYTSWNLWGSEFLRINTKSLSYSRSYGIIQTTEKVIEFKSLAVSYEKIRFFDGVEHGRLIFFDYDDLDNPFEVFQTTILIPKLEIDEILDMIENLFRPEDSFEVLKNSISLN